METLPCETIAYRAMTRRGWIDPVSRRVLPAAFKRRPPPSDDDGLSVDIQSAQSCVAKLNKTFGVATLKVGRIRDLGLDVVVDAAPHANIVHLPRDSDDPAQAEWFASQLAKQARLIAPEEYATAQGGTP